MIKVWNFEFNNAQGRALPDNEDAGLVQGVFDRMFARLAALEPLGFEGVFFSEHHFLDSLSPNPNLLIAALAKMTQRLRLGVMGNVLALHQPWRLAEDLAMLDYITDGRLEIGTAAGIPPEFMFIDVPVENVRPMFAEVLQFLDRARESKTVSHEGKYWNYRDIIVMPRPKKPDRRREWMTMYSASTAQLAARRNAKVATGYQSTASAAESFKAYRAAAAESGIKVGPDDIALRRQVMICDTDAQAEALHRELLACSIERQKKIFRPLNERMAKALGAGMPEGIARSGVRDAAAIPSSRTDPKRTNFTPFTSGFVDMNDEFIYGSPETVATKIIEQCSRTGAGNLLAYHSESLEEDELAHHYKLWERVLPMLASANV
jgi:alkanesulfonate monooxygenase SsuD/methylene tetrahydromethanopterin reductase-like flavin-dependent oxidoreductase (luciferase family)